MIRGRGMDTFDIFLVSFFGIWAASILVLFLPLVIKPPAGPNRFGPRPEPRSFTGAIQTVFGKFFYFKGRASRSEYWYFYLFQTIAVVALSLATTMVSNAEWPITILGIGVSLPFYALNARRLHDRNRSGWWQLISIAGFGLGSLALLIWLIFPPKDET